MSSNNPISILRQINSYLEQSSSNSIKNGSDLHKKILQQLNKRELRRIPEEFEAVMVIGKEKKWRTRISAGRLIDGQLLTFPEATKTSLGESLWDDWRELTKDRKIPQECI